MFYSRGKNKVSNPYNLSDMYEAYINTVDKDTSYDISRQDFISMTNDYLEEVKEFILEGRSKFKMPYKLGSIDVDKLKVDLNKLRRIDWKRTSELGKRVYHLNEHSDGYDYIIMWRKIDTLRNNHMYRYVPARNIKRTLAKLIKDKKFDTFSVK